MDRRDPQAQPPPLTPPEPFERGQGSASPTTSGPITSKGEAITSKGEPGDPRDREFPCTSCGAKLFYEPGTTTLKCEHCGLEARFAIPAVPIRELDYLGALHTLEAGAEHDDEIVVHCESCGADVKMGTNLVSGTCSFCGTPIVAEGHSRKHIRPRSLVPFAVKRAQAEDLFIGWVKSLWFAPSGLKKLAAIERRPHGVYLPHWTYDARSRTSYTGMRGDVYSVTQQVSVVVNGRRETRTQQVPKIRWTPVSGVVHNAFDDVLVTGSQSLPPEKVDRVGPWTLQGLTPYTDEFLSGFFAESYTIDLPSGFAAARAEMERAIRASVQRDIGGDQQQIHSVDPRYEGITFKHILLPLWVSAYRYHGTSYRFIINGQSGAVTGDRPYSAWKIAALILAIALVIAAIVLITQM
jgi:predicted RNA-binding Zn-ribbon protein involved in translation (DUF1610 family)